MYRQPISKKWENATREQAEAAKQEFERRKAAKMEEMRAQARGEDSPTSLDESLRSETSELEVQEPLPPYPLQQAPPTPPFYDDEAPEVDSDEQIRRIQKVVRQKEIKIKILESELESEKDNRRYLQAKRHEAVDAQRRTDDEVGKLKREVANLDQLLDGSIKRQKELESELDMCRQESRDLKRQLHEERCNYESDIRARETRERQIRQQFENASGALLNGTGMDRRQNEDTRSILEGETQSEKS